MRWYGHFLIKDGVIYNEKLLDADKMEMPAPSNGEMMYTHICRTWEGKRADELRSTYPGTPGDALLYYAMVDDDELD